MHVRYKAKTLKSLCLRGSQQQRTIITATATAPALRPRQHNVFINTLHACVQPTRATVQGGYNQYTCEVF